MRQAFLSALAAAGLLSTLFACDSAFRSGDSGSQGTPASFALELPDGSTQATLSETDPLTLLLWVPDVGFRNLLPPGTGTIDPGFFFFQATPGLAGGSPDDDLSGTLVQQGLIQVGARVGRRVPLTVTLSPTGPLPLPLGLTVLSASVVDDLGRASPVEQLQVTVLALDRPTVVLRLEVPPAGTTPTGLLLPTNAGGNYFVGQGLPFALTFDALPNPSTGSGFTDLLGGSPLDPRFLQVIADQDLGDPGNGGFAAGSNLAALFGTNLDILVDPGTGALNTGALWPMNDPLSPTLGVVTFLVTVVDDAGAASTPQAITLEVEPLVSLDAMLMPLIRPACGFNGCHGPSAPTFGLQLDTAAAMVQTSVWVDAFETDELSSCAPWLVEPYQDAASYFLHKVVGTHQGGCVQGSGNRMPPGGPFFDSNQANLLAQWVLQGAFEN